MDKKISKKNKPVSKAVSAEEESLDALIASIRAKFGEESVMKLGEIKHANIESISSGSFSLDLALGVGGFPKGRIVEIFGPEMSGKSTLGLQIIAEAQKKRRKSGIY